MGRTPHGRAVRVKVRRPASTSRGVQISRTDGAGARPGRAPELPGYQVLEVVGRGGFATVYRAHEPAFNRDVAIKVIDVAEVSDEARLRFERECRAVGSLSEHPGIVTVYGAGGAADGRPFIVMAYLPLGSLGARIKAGRTLRPAEAVAVGIDLLDAVGAAHEIGIVHRDIKPDNVLVSRYGRPELGDFGISSMPGTYETRSGFTAHTLGFAAPEVVDGQRATPASDLYSLGATLATLITGTSIFGRPGEDSVVAYLNRVMNQPPPSLVPAGASPELDAVVQRALAKSPADRFASAADFADALRGVPEHTGQPPRLGPLPAAARHQDQETMRKDLPAVTGRIEVAPPARSRTRVYAAVGAATGALVLLGGGVAAAVLGAGGKAAAPPSPQPVAVAPTLSSDCHGLTCRLSATAHAGASYTWTFGDGSSEAGTSQVAHTYPAPGTFAAQVAMTIGGRTVRAEPVNVVIMSFARRLRLVGGQLVVTVPAAGSAASPCGAAVELQRQSGARWTPAQSVTLGPKRQTITVAAGVYRLHAPASDVAGGVCPEAASTSVTATAPVAVSQPSSPGGTSVYHPPTSSGTRKIQPVRPR